MNSRKITFLLLLFFAACSVKKDLGRDIQKDVSAEFITKNRNILSTAPSDKWWMEFNDETLNKLVELGLENNKDIQSASLAIATSRQLNNVSITKLLPTGTAGIGRQRFASPGFGPNGVSYDLYQSTFDAAWELDFFGKNLDRYRAGKLRFLKEAQLYKAIALRITSEIAHNYIELKRAKKQIENLQKISDLKKQLIEISEKKQKTGMFSKSDFHRAEIDFDSASSALIEAQTEEKVLTYRLAVLIGFMPEKMAEFFAQENQKNIFQKKIFDYSSGLVPVGLKSDILKRRPDILAAEYEIDAADFDRSAQFKEFFPSFNLTAKIGGGSKSLGDVLKDGANVKDISGRISVPIFSIGQLMAEYKISKAKARSAIIDYEKTVLAAIEECESQIVRYANALQIENNSSHSLSAQKKIFRIDKNKKSFGVISREDLIHSEVTLLISENEMAQKKSSSLINLIALHKAIGGGFDGYEIRFKKDRVFMSEVGKGVK
ncbi:MAG: TolC family protein [Proteobacteria bacterium]|nr:TolC family protein [Pseudomonadota bacterium]